MRTIMQLFKHVPNQQMISMLLINDIYLDSFAG